MPQGAIGTFATHSILDLQEMGQFFVCTRTEEKRAKKRKSYKRHFGKRVLHMAKLAVKWKDKVNDSSISLVYPTKKTSHNPFRSLYQIDPTGYG
jgi:hypothetical protein